MDFLIESGVVLKAAFLDTAKNIFRPVHNLRVIVGLEDEKSVAEVVQEALAESRAARGSNRPSTPKGMSAG